jgi:hypothetical protein
MSLTLICRRNSATLSAFCPDFRLLRRLLWLIPVLILLMAGEGAPLRAATQYPQAVSKLTLGRVPFAPADSSMRHDFLLKPLREAGTGKIYGAGIALQIETLGPKLLVLDTAARGLLLKERAQKAGGLVHAPDWLRPGPGIQTGLFRLFPKISQGRFALTTVVAEIFWQRGFRWVDGIISTQILEPWIVRLDFPHMKMSLIPSMDYIAQAECTLPATLANNWWLTPVEILDKPALMLLDSGASRTYVSQQWLHKNLSPAFSANKNKNKAGQFFEAGMCTLRLKQGGTFRRIVLGTSADLVPNAGDVVIDGVLAFDVLRELAIDLDYRSQKIYLAQEF